MKRGEILRQLTTLSAIFLISGSVGVAGDGSAVTSAPAPRERVSTTAPVVVDSSRVGDGLAPIDNPSLLHPWDIPQYKDTTINSNGDGGPATSRRLPGLDSERPESSAKGAGAGGGNLPRAIELSGNYPNPFNAQTNIKFALADGGSVRIDVYNLLGGVVRTMALSGLSAGPHVWTWDGRVAGGSEAPSGVYFYRISNEHSSVIGKMVLLK